MTDTISKDDGLLHELYSINADIDEIKNRLSAFQESVAELIIEKPEKPQIPEGYKAFEATEDSVCPVPFDCEVSVIYKNINMSPITGFAKYFDWDTNEQEKFVVAYYKVTHVPTLEYDKDNLPEVFFSASDGRIFKYGYNDMLFEKAMLKAGLAYASELHVDTAEQWGLLPEELV